MINMTTQPKFSDFWTIEDTKRQLAFPKFPSKGTPAEQNTWRQTVGEEQGRHIGLAIGQFIASKMQHMRVLPLFCEETDVRIINSLRALRDHPEDQDCQFEVGDRFASRMEVYIALHPSRESENSPEAVHEKLIGVMEDGDFRFYTSDHGPCMRSGMRIDVIFENWSGTAGVMEHEVIPGSFRLNYTFTPLTAQSIEAPRAQCVQIQVPSGQLLITDWIRIPEFHELGQAIDHDPGHDINTVEGRATQTRLYAEKLGVAHVPCRSPDILADEGVIKGGYLDIEEAYPANFKGKFYADLRWTTLVDRSHLIDLIAEKLGQVEATRQVNEYIQDNKEDMIVLDVKPGTHHLYFAGTPQVFHSTIDTHYEADCLHMEQFQYPAFALTREPLVEKCDVQSAPRKSRRP